jgi:hypothetical protein
MELLMFIRSKCPACFLAYWARSPVLRVLVLLEGTAGTRGTE